MLLRSAVRSRRLIHRRLNIASLSSWCRVPPSLSVIAASRSHAALSSCGTDGYPLLTSFQRYYHSDGALAAGAPTSTKIRPVLSSCRRCYHNGNGDAPPPPSKICIGHVEMDLSQYPSRSPHLIPRSYLPSDPSLRSPTLLRHLQWMLSKDVLGQDMMLVGAPGSGSLHRRNLALMYAEMTSREVEVLTLSGDVTESDLKQRRELVHKQKQQSKAFSLEGEDNGRSTATVEFADQAPVRAALHGRLLILDGLEKAERNVLPTINNLLENREMHLEDGRFLVSPQRYKDLLDSGSFDADSSFLVPTHPNFRVVALATPSPPFPGRGLDPPLRSRFQIRRVDHPSAEELYANLLKSSGGVDEEIAGQLSAFAAAMNNAATDFSSSSSSGRTLVFPSGALSSVAKTLNAFPNEDQRSVLARLYPPSLHDDRFDRVSGPSNSEASRKSFDRACDELGIVGDAGRSLGAEYEMRSIQRSTDDPSMATVSFSSPSPESASFFGGNDESASSSASVVEVPAGMNELHRPSSSFVQTQGTTLTIKSMMQEHAAGRDILLLSPRGEGKSTIAYEFASVLGYDTCLFNLYREMAGRDLLQRRSTDPMTGETTWEDSILVQAARRGDLCILDGVERLSPDTIATLSSLFTEREISLPDGSRLIRSNRADTSTASSDLIQPIHPSFRIVALGSLSNDVTSSWLADDVMSMMSTLLVPTPSEKCMRAILASANPNCPESIVDRLLQIRAALTDDAALDCGVQPLSTRNLLRIVRLAKDDKSDLHDAVESVLLAGLLPPIQRAALESLLESNGVKSTSRSKKRGNHSRQSEDIVVNTDSVTIGDVVFKRREVKRTEMVPKPDFVDIPNQVITIKGLLSEVNAGERSFLLLGNQGVGKNKLTDRLCEIGNFEREYIQLHRDSTIGSLTLAPSLEDGKIIWKDSPLIRAVQEGVALVIDEADKAPVEVIAVLKSLVGDGELLLADGRRISRTGDGEGIIRMHPDFTLFVLANRPGYPFHGNDFFREVGDCFSVHVVPNPDLESEINLLSSYGPDVDSSLIRQIAASFDHLRSLSEAGDISYPYSTREAVAVIKHLQQYPEDGVISAVHNVLDFDTFDDSMYSMIGEVFVHHGIEMSDYSSWRAAQSRAAKADAQKSLEIEYTQQRDSEGSSSSPPPLSGPKLGRWDDANEIHVGGNQWAGGTGGSDTAGLGGRGGPYRLDRGHKVHQVSDEAKAQVSEEAQRAARQMAQKALKEKLDEIDMSDNQWEAYTQFLEPIRKDISIMRTTLKSVEGKSSEKTWIKRQSHGEIDETKLVEGVAGERYIYKRRGVDHDSPLSPLQRPKRIRFVMDLSGSMYRFNSYDGRLNRSLEATLLIMSAFDGMSDRFQYSIVGHSGDSPSIPLVQFGAPPKNESDMMRILQGYIAHTQYCQSGDYTLEAVEHAIEDALNDKVDEEESEEYVVAISDANLARYGIHPRELGRIVQKGADAATPVKAHVIFLASFGQEAEDIRRSLPPGRGHICMETKDLPLVVRSILTSSVE